MRGRQRGLVALLILAAAPLATAIGADVTAMEPIFVTARMPDYKVTHEDAYLCTAVPLPDQALKLVGVEPLAKQEIAHHMLLFGALPPLPGSASAPNDTQRSLPLFNDAFTQ